MEELLFLAHRIPFPPNKGDKVRSYHAIKALTSRYRVHVGAFVDDPSDWSRRSGLAAIVNGETFFARLDKRWATLKSVRGLLTGEPLSLPYYRNNQMSRWVRRMLSERNIHRVVIYSSPMAQYVADDPSLVRVADIVDVDSDKWRQYSATKPWPVSWLYTREARQLLQFERRVAREFTASVFVAAHETAFFRTLAPESAHRVHVVPNGVDSDYFSPIHAFPNPFSAQQRAIVFTGAMDYWPNVDAVEWFADNVFPQLRSKFPESHLYVVGARPADRLGRLATMPGVVVTGGVPDVRPYLAHATLSVAPLRISRGIQNKVLEAMAMGKIVIASPQAAEGITARVGEDLLVADGVDQWVKAASAVLAGQASLSIGAAARERVVRDYSWQAYLDHLVRLLDGNGMTAQHAAEV